MNRDIPRPDPATGESAAEPAGTPPSPAAAEAHAATDAALSAMGAAPAWWRRASTWIGAGLVAIAVGAALSYANRGAAPPAAVYVTEPVARGDLTLRVVANGTLQPTRSVGIGSELSGTVADVLVDLNDRVRKGQVLLSLDPVKLRNQVARSRATLASSEAKVQQSAATVREAQDNLARLEEVSRLSGGKVPSATELDTARATLARAQADEASAKAAVADAKAALATDETNLEKSSIRSPIDGVVLSRSVDPGNAVAASLQAVTLFTIGEDLHRLKLDVNVDEADVGSVAVGQKADFTVAAYPNRRFPATITRVSYGSTTTDNVVTYITELDVANPELSLRPGMTATATIVSTERHGVLRVPNAALRYAPAAQAPAPQQGGSIVSRMIPRPPQGAPRRPAAETAKDGTGGRTVWVLRDGQPIALPVSVGISDGRMTEITGGELQAGMAVITDQRSAPK